MPGKLATSLTMSRPITIAAEHASMNMKGRTARPASLGAESIVGLRSANSTALKRRLVQDTLWPLPFLSACHFDRRQVMIAASHFIVIADLQALTSPGAANNRSPPIAGMILRSRVRCLAGEA